MGRRVFVATPSFVYQDCASNACPVWVHILLCLVVMQCALCFDKRDSAIGIQSLGLHDYIILLLPAWLGWIQHREVMLCSELSGPGCVLEIRPMECVRMCAFLFLLRTVSIIIDRLLIIFY